MQNLLARTGLLKQLTTDAQIMASFDGNGTNLDTYWFIFNCGSKGTATNEDFLEFQKRQNIFIKLAIEAGFSVNLLVNSEVTLLLMTDWLKEKHALLCGCPNLKANG